MKTKSERNTGIIFSIGFGVILPQMILPLVESLKINLLTPLWYIFYSTVFYKKHIVIANKMNTSRYQKEKLHLDFCWGYF